MPDYLAPPGAPFDFTPLYQAALIVVPILLFSGVDLKPLVLILGVFIWVVSGAQRQAAADRQAYEQEMEEHERRRSHRDG